MAAPFAAKEAARPFINENLSDEEFRWKSDFCDQWRRSNSRFFSGL